MAHHLVRVAQHVRRELLRAVEGISEEDGQRSVHGINPVAWMVGHLAAQEQAYWLEPRGEALVSERLKSYRRTLPKELEDMEVLLEGWWEVTRRADAWLVTLSEDDLRQHLLGQPSVLFKKENVGSLLARVIGHYYLHIGQMTAVRKMLGYRVPTFVGSQQGAYFE